MSNRIISELYLALPLTQRPPHTTKDRVRELLEKAVLGRVRDPVGTLLDKKSAHIHDGVIRLCELLVETHLTQECVRALEDSLVSATLHASLGTVVSQNTDWTVLCYANGGAGCSRSLCPPNCPDRCCVSTEWYRAFLSTRRHGPL